MREGVRLEQTRFTFESEVMISKGEPMSPEARTALKSELEQFGMANDRSATARGRRMLNITPDTGAFLSVLVRATSARRILEVGTSNGYSTLWLAEAANVLGGHVTTLESSDYKLGLARMNFQRAGLASVITLRPGDAGAFLRETTDCAYDFIFLDSERSEYTGWWKDVRRALRPGGLLVADNATSHVAEMAPFVSLVMGDPAFATTVVPVGNGEFLAVKEGESTASAASGL